MSQTLHRNSGEPKTINPLLHSLTWSLLALTLVTQQIAHASENVFTSESEIKSPIHTRAKSHQAMMIPPPPPLPPRHARKHAKRLDFFPHFFKFQTAFAADFDQANYAGMAAVAALQAHSNIPANHPIKGELSQYLGKLSNSSSSEGELAGHYTQVLTQMGDAGLVDNPRFRKLTGAARAYENTVNRSDATDIEISRQYNEIAKHYFDQVKDFPNIAPAAQKFKEACQEWATAFRRGTDPEASYQKVLDSYEELATRYTDHVAPGSSHDDLLAAAQLACDLPSQVKSTTGGPTRPCPNNSHKGPNYRFYDSKAPGYFMTNFYGLRGKTGTKGPGVVIDGASWPTTEHYFQASKFPKGSAPYLAIKSAQTPKDAFRIANDPANKNLKDPHFDHNKIAIMCKAVSAKFDQHHDLQDQLCNDTGTSIIEEDSGDRDGFWGNGQFVSQKFDGSGRAVAWTDSHGRSVNPQGHLVGVKNYVPGENNKLGEILMSSRQHFCGTAMPSHNGHPIEDPCATSGAPPVRKKAPTKPPTTPTTPITTGQPITLNSTGRAVPQYYTRVYNDATACSDHGPVIYGNTATWNITYQGRLAGTFYNHKFQGLTVESDTQYTNRLNRIADGIAAMLTGPGAPKIMLLQELPLRDSTFDDQLKNKLKSLGFSYQRNGNQGIVVPGAGTASLPPTGPQRGQLVNYVTGKVNPANKDETDAIKRMTPFLDRSTNIVYFSVHVPMMVSDSRLCEIMMHFAAHSKTLFPGASVKFSGDFNRAASGMITDPTCKSSGIKGISTTVGDKAFSAGSNGDNPNNIDLEVRF